MKLDNPPLLPGETIKGVQWGVRFDKRGEDDYHICLQLMQEDDGSWFDVGCDGGCGSSSSFWVFDLLDVLELAKTALEERAKLDMSGFGYVFICQRERNSV